MCPFVCTCKYSGVNFCDVKQTGSLLCRWFSFIGLRHAGSLPCAVFSIKWLCMPIGDRSARAALAVYYGC